MEFEDAEEYRDAVGLKNGRKSANNDLEVLSHLYSCLIRWDDELKFLVDKALQLHKKINSPNLFSTREGKSYIYDAGLTSGFDSMWRRFLDRALDETDLEERFTEHDLRAKNASDEEDDELASRRLDHASKSPTNRVYRGKAEKVDT